MNISADLPRSFVLCGEGRQGPPLIYLSPLSPAALLRRAESDSFE